MLSQVLLADKQQLSVEGMKHILSGDPAFQVAGEVNDMQSLETKIQQLIPDILVLDYHSFEHLSHTFCQQIMERFPALKILVITSDHNRAQILKYVEIGIPALLTKDCSRQEILNAFHALARGQKFYCSRVLDLLVENQFVQKRAHAALSEREIQIITYIAEGLSTQQLASRMNLSPHTINAYRKSILKKLEVKTPVEMIVKAFRLQIIPIS